MHTPITISGGANDETRIGRARHGVIVIIAAGLLGLSPGGASAEDLSLTTVAATGNAARVQPGAAAPTAATLTTVTVGGSTVYSPPQLFATYREQLGRPISREGARAILASLADLYVRDGYVKPEFALDDALTGRGVLRVHVYEAQVSSVIFEGDGRFRDALDEIGARLENARP